MKNLAIVLTTHAQEQARKRGTTAAEVEQVIQEQLWSAARDGRRETKGNFSFSGEWNKKFYKTKQVNPVFIEENERIIVITVYVFYFN